MMQSALPNAFKNNPNLHAYLYVSPDKSSRSSTAVNIAMSMLCRNASLDGTPCGECDCCKKISAGAHPDCIILTNGEKTSVKEIRAIEDEAYLAPNEADSKVFILEDAGGYNVQSQNALLKIIEEPPKGVKFVLTAASGAELLPTVRSRVCLLSGEIKSAESIASQISQIKKQLDSDSVQRLSHFVAAYDKADINNIDETAIFDYTELACDFLSAKKPNVLLALPKKAEDLAVCLEVFMLCIGQIAAIKCSGNVRDGILSRKQFSDCNAKTSLKKAHTLYDVFEKAYLMLQSNANVNAVLGFIWTNAA